MYNLTERSQKHFYETINELRIEYDDTKARTAYQRILVLEKAKFRVREWKGQLEKLIQKHEHESL